MTTDEAIDLLHRAETNAAHITAIVATDAAQSERSVAFTFTPEESAQLFRVARLLLERRAQG